jgi:hypothetical protein
MANVCVQGREDFATRCACVRVRSVVSKWLPTCVYPGVYHDVFEMDTLDVEGVQSNNFR